ncbi:Metallo-dependent phosphatase [Ascodesmis nigricans]|uniref:Metallo-dependent phosphatase n=1 Tax=Ascodesmis nigricans TaxID=341454 RepID=A0A4S2MM16_9PEZI|nr:Metallo-dependent phosphatase [Ascodesmis nigricans]
MADAAPSSITYDFGAASRGSPDLRFLHYNDVYHIESAPGQPGGAARFVTLTNHYRSQPGPRLLTFFSGDAFNPSIESSITKGRHMVPILNEIGTDVACLGNHDLDFGVDQAKYLIEKCTFPWLCANVEDRSLGEGVGIAGLKKSVVLETEDGEGRKVKVGVVGIVEREWLDTINTLPPDLKYVSASEMARREARRLKKEEKVEIVVVVSHQREPNDVKLATNVGGEYIDIILGGHDHHYAHQIINNVHVIRSGCDFKQLSYIECFRIPSPSPEGPRWNFFILRRDITAAVPEDPRIKTLVASLTSNITTKLSKPIGYTSTPLDSRFSVIRRAESNLGNFVCDLMRFYYSADCTIMAGGTIRGDTIYPPGVIQLGDIISCFPFEDPVVVVRVTGKVIWAALENGVSKLPALEGRFPHVSGISYTFNSTLPSGSRILSTTVAGTPITRDSTDKTFTMATRAYMVKGKDGFTSLLGAEELVDEENGVLISMILRQYFLSLKVLGKWSRGGWFRTYFSDLRKKMEQNGELVVTEKTREHVEVQEEGVRDEGEWQVDSPGVSEDEADVDADNEGDAGGTEGELTRVTTKEMMLAKRIGNKWAKKAGVETSLGEVDWTMCVNPKVEGRIRDVAGEV